MLRTEQIIKLIGPMAQAGSAAAVDFNRIEKITGRVGRQTTKQRIIKAMQAGCTNAHQIADALGSDRSYISEILRELVHLRIVLVTKNKSAKNQNRFIYRLKETQQ